MVVECNNYLYDIYMYCIFIENLLLDKCNCKLYIICDL